MQYVVKAIQEKMAKIRFHIKIHTRKSNVTKTYQSIRTQSIRGSGAMWAITSASYQHSSLDAFFSFLFFFKMHASEQEALTEQCKAEWYMSYKHEIEHLWPHVYNDSYLNVVVRIFIFILQPETQSDPRHNTINMMLANWMKGYKFNTQISWTFSFVLWFCSQDHGIFLKNMEVLHTKTPQW